MRFFANLSAIKNEMSSRRKFIKGLGLSLGGVILGSKAKALSKVFSPGAGHTGKPVVLSTWNYGLAANAKAWEMLHSGSAAIDAVEAGVSVTESDLSNQSVGLGGRPDAEGYVTLDACIMNEKCECGAVAFLQHIDHPIQVARKVMEETPHVMLVGSGAYKFALKQGFERSTVEVPQPKPLEKYKKWLEHQKQTTPVNLENHDTIGMIAIDDQGNLSGACTTSGLAYKLHGRVGDSPIIGAGLYVDNEVGAAVATGVGEMVIRTAGAHTVVELMRNGASPEEACKGAIQRIIKWHPDVKGKQVGFLAINKSGETGAYAIHKGFLYAKAENNENTMFKSAHQN